MITVSIGQGAGISPDFTSFAAFWASVPSTVLDDYTVNLLWASSANEFIDPNFNLTGKNWGSFRLTIQAGAGMSFRDHPSRNSNPLRYNAAVGACWRVNNSAERCLGLNTGNIRLTVRGIQFKSATAGTHNNRCLELVNVYDDVYEDNVFEGGGNFAVLVNNLTGGPGDGFNQEFTGRFRRNVFHVMNASTTGLSTRSWSKRQLVETFGNTYYCSAAGSTGTGEARPNTSSANQYRTVNNVVVGFGTDFSFPPAVGGTGIALRRNNATSLASGSSGLGVDASNVYSVVAANAFVNTVGATADLRLRDDAALLLGRADRDYARATDVLGNGWSGLPDLGAFENQNQGPAPQFAFMLRRSPQMAGFYNLDFPRVR